MIRVGIIGATGYTGAELVRLLCRHPRVELVGLTSRTYSGEPYWRIYPHLRNYVDRDCEELDLGQLVGRSDVVFTALPHSHSMDVAREIVKQGKRLVDLGADFRLKSRALYERWYGVTHTASELLADAVYGLPELYREQIRGARLVANPGCYPTASILAAAPLLKRDLVYPDSIIIDAKTGVSGAGRSFSLAAHYAEANENVLAYKVAAHRHTPEIEQELGLLAGQDLLISFTPHLVPATRGILATAYAKMSRFLDREELFSVYAEFYRDEPFVRVLPPGVLPRTKAVSGSNHCDIGVVSDSRTKRAVIVTAIDNLVKGASGQAVQNMNLMCGLDEATGLQSPGLYP